jgi:hypothetical protein
MSDPAMTKSNYARNARDRYWTHPWVTTALLQSVKIPQYIWEPAAGRGDITNVLLNQGYDVFSSDIDMSEYRQSDYYSMNTYEDDFLSDDSLPEMVTNEQKSQRTEGIITNPPYGRNAVAFARHGLEIMKNNKDLKFMAMLMRSEFCHAKTRKDLFGECEYYWGEVVLTTRPRWDWWFRDEPEASPRHNFSWFVWRKDMVILHPSQIFHYRDYIWLFSFLFYQFIYLSV